MLKWINTCFLLIVTGLHVFAGGPYARKARLTSDTRESLHKIEKTLSAHPEESIKELDGIIKLAIKEDLQPSLSLAYYLMGVSYTELKQPQLALHFIDLAEENYLKNKDRKLEKYEVTKNTGKPQEFYFTKGEILSQLQRYQEANQNYKVYKKRANNKSSARKTNYAIARNEYAQENYTEAISLYEQLLQEELARNDEIQIRVCYSRLAACYISIDNTELGLKYYNKSVQGIDDILMSENEEISASENYNTYSKNKEVVSQALRKQNKVEEELDLRNRALSVLDDSMEHLRLAQLHYQEKDIVATEKSLDQYFANISYNLIDKKEITVIREMAFKLESKNAAKAFTYLKYYEELSDTINTRLLSLQIDEDQLGKQGYENTLQLEILRKNKEISDNTISSLMHQSELKEENLKSQKTIIYLLTGIAIIVLIALVYIIKVSQQRRVANQKLALRSLRTQMNPHFIFNALNSVNSFISVSDERSANRFLTEFSTLMRTVMENSEHEFISLTKEVDILRIYLELEHFRFKDKFDYHLEIPPNLDTDDWVIPPMLIQPYVENAIWHGLRYKESKGNLTVSLQKAKEHLQIEVIDDGIGREKSQEIKTKNQRKTSSTALKNIQERVTLFNALHQLKVDVQITDLNTDGTGTKVIILIPQPQI